ncbi:MAG: sucrose synthase [Hyphomicrobiaceae bacterium]|nr:sucrose synthase [Hyphomicrobiaceae bacterium]
MSQLPVEIGALRNYMTDQRAVAHRILHHISTRGRPFLLRSQILDALDELSRPDGGIDPAEFLSPLMLTLRKVQEAAHDGAVMFLALRARIGRWSYLRILLDAMDVQQVPVHEFLAFKEHLVKGGAQSSDDWTLEIDFEPFQRDVLKMREARSIGSGVEFLNRRLSNKLFDVSNAGKGSPGEEKLLEFLRLHKWHGQQLMLNGLIENVPDLREALRKAQDHLAALPGDAQWATFVSMMHQLGFEVGWGRNATEVADMMQYLQDILEAPSPAAIENFLKRVPMIFSVVILSPHGWFGQANVLGRPDTGGQVVYILDQVRALEREMRERLARQGLEIEPQIIVVTRQIPEAEGTTANERKEMISGTRNAFILRVPFRHADGAIHPHWLSRFEIWPYLERFSFDVEREVLAELSGRPDLIVGNYSDGNLVAALLSHRLRVTQCNVAHALEKTKYLYSDLYWKDNDAHYHFSSQFTADLIAMNAADFIIASTYQEIAGTSETVGQYESHIAYTLPGLYRVVSGVDVFDPKFNIVSPGADADIFFPTSETDRRLPHLVEELDRLVFGEAPEGMFRGRLSNPGKPLLLTMARMDRIKNVTGLARWFGENLDLRQRCNLLIVSGHVDPGRSSDNEEREQIGAMHQLMNDLQLDGEVRWLGMHLEKALSGELYRFVADRRGAFVQPALFEAFGLTVIEAMATGLPVFATCFGGPLEIIEDGRSGFHIDPNHGDAAARRINQFMAACEADPAEWQRISRGALDRVEARYTWNRYAERLMTLSRIYGFWRHITDLDRTETWRYLEMLYGLQFRPLVAQQGS